MNPQIRKALAAGFLLFVALFAAGIVRSFVIADSELPRWHAGHWRVALSSGSDDDHRTGSRTANNLAQIGLAQQPLPQVFEDANFQKILVFEKTAQLIAGTTQFSVDEERVRKTLAAEKAITFSERAAGIAPDRALVLGISVHPDRFDSLQQSLSKVGHVESSTVQQQDRTGEFRKLHAQRQSLKKHQDALLKLRAVEKLSVEEALKLEQKILEIEKETQSLGVQLGDLLGKEPSYNLFVTLHEVVPGSSSDQAATLPRRLSSAFAWAFAWWTTLAIGVALLAATYWSVRTLAPEKTSAEKRSA